MPNFGAGLAAVSREVRAWPLSSQRMASALTPAQLRQSADDMERGPDTPRARRMLADELEARGISEASPRRLAQLWEVIR